MFSGGFLLIECRHSITAKCVMLDMGSKISQS
jgi:hypothetical protein